MSKICKICTICNIWTISSWLWHRTGSSWSTVWTGGALEVWPGILFPNLNSRGNKLRRISALDTMQYMLNIKICQICNMCKMVVHMVIQHMCKKNLGPFWTVAKSVSLSVSDGPRPQACHVENLPVQPSPAPNWPSMRAREPSECARARKTRHLKGPERSKKQKSFLEKGNPFPKRTILLGKGQSFLEKDFCLLETDYIGLGPRPRMRAERPRQSLGHGQLKIGATVKLPVLWTRHPGPGNGVLEVMILNLKRLNLTYLSSSWTWNIVTCNNWA